MNEWENVGGHKWLAIFSLSWTKKLNKSRRIDTAITKVHDCSLASDLRRWIEWMKMDSRKSSGGETRMLERRVSNNRADLSGDQRMNYFLSWFQSWSELQKADFVTILHSNMNNSTSCGVNATVNGDSGKKPPSLFECQVKLFNEWFSGWSDDQKNYIVVRLQAIDPDFYARYSSFETKDDQEKKDYFEPGVPPELVRKSSRSVLGPHAATFNAHDNLQDPPPSLKSFKDVKEGESDDDSVEEEFRKLSTAEDSKSLETITE